jgi:leucyl aminopeptidase
MQITFSAAALPKSGAIVLPLFDDGKPTSAFDAVDKASDGAISRAMKAASFKPKKGKVLEIVSPGALSNGFVFLIGAGAKKDLDALAAQAVGGLGMARALATKEKSVVFALDGFSSSKIDDGAAAAEIAHGARLRAYRFDKYRTKEEKDDKPTIEKIVVNTPAKGAKSAFAPWNGWAGRNPTRQLLLSGKASLSTLAASRSSRPRAWKT